MTAPDYLPRPGREWVVSRAPESASGHLGKLKKKTRIGGACAIEKPNRIEPTPARFTKLGQFRIAPANSPQEQTPLWSRQPIILSPTK
jgi:hypothetical protein